MLKSSATKPSRLILLAPFGYAFISRYHWPRDFIVNAATAWVPGIILVAMLGDQPLGTAITNYLLGYAAFIGVYEVGYLANDSVGLRHDPTPRRRVDLDISPGFVAAFIIIRLGVLLAAAVLLGVVASPLYWSILASLVALLVAHNMLRGIEMKFYTFLQLSLLRFSVPVWPVMIPAEKTDAMLTTLVTGLLLFTLPRFLTYLDAKGRLSLPERKARTYHLRAHFAVAPLIFALSVLTREPAPMACLIWGLTVQLAYVTRRELPAHLHGPSQT